MSSSGSGSPPGEGEEKGRAEEEEKGRAEEEEEEVLQALRRVR